MSRELVWKIYNPSHNITKQSMLECIDRYEQVGHCPDAVTKTDFYGNPTAPNDYMRIFIGSSGSANVRAAILDKYWCSDFTVSSSWFQQYHTNDFHGWHCHGNCSISMSYLLELDDRKHSTEFVDIERKDTFQLDVTEGDIIIFPSYVIHRSPLIKSDSRKTTVAININLGQLNIPRIDDIDPIFEGTFRE